MFFIFLLNNPMEFICISGDIYRPLLLFIQLQTIIASIATNHSSPCDFAQTFIYVYFQYLKEHYTAVANILKTTQFNLLTFNKQTARVLQQNGFIQEQQRIAIQYKQSNGETCRSPEKQRRDTLACKLSLNIHQRGKNAIKNSK